MDRLKQFRKCVHFCEDIRLKNSKFACQKLRGHAILDQNDKRWEWQDIRMAEIRMKRNQNDKKSEWQEIRMTRNQNDKKSEWQENIMTGNQNDKKSEYQEIRITRSYFDKMSCWQEIKITKEYIYNKRSDWEETRYRQEIRMTRDPTVFTRDSID